MLSSSKIEEVSQNCFGLDGVKFRKSRRVASFSTLSSSKIGEVSQTCCVFKLTDRQTDRQTGSQAGRQADRQIDIQLQLQLQLEPRYNYKCKNTTLHYTTLITLHYPTLHYTTLRYTTLQLQLQLQLQAHYTALHHTTSSSCGEVHCNHCNRSKKHDSNHLSVHQWIRSAIRDSQQLTSPIGCLFVKLPPPP